MNSILNKNLSLFKQRFSALYNIYNSQIEDIKKNGIPSFWHVNIAKSGEQTCIETINQSEIHLHSAYNPGREAQSFIKNNFDAISQKSTTLFYGFGVGYHVIEWAKQFGQSDKKLVLLECDVYHFLAALCILDWTNVFSVPQLIIALECPVESVLGLVENTEKINLGNEGVSDCFFVQNPVFIKHNEAYFSNVHELIKRNIRKNEINAATLKKFEKLWTRNTTINKKQLNQLKGINDFENRFAFQNDKEFSFVVVGAGPTLQNIIPKLQQMKKENGNFLKIICVETALHHLLRNNINPDFIILSDPQYWAYKHICGLKAEESCLITDISVYPGVFNFDCKEILLMSAQFPLAKQFEKEAGLSLIDLGTGGSVASVAFNFAVFTGCKKIYLAGIDFSFPYKQSHVKGSSAEQAFHTASTKLKSVESFTSSVLYSANPQVASAYNGKPVLTDSRMKMFAWWFESRIAALPEVTVYTLTEDALCIPNVKYIVEE